MIQFKIDSGDIQSALVGLPAEIDATEKDVLELVGISLLSDVKLDFEKKSRHETSNGIKWKELTDARERAKARKGGWKGGKNDTPPKSQINVDTGLLRNSSTPGFSTAGGGNVMKISEHEVTVGYGREYAKYVDEIRSLIPDPTPKEWVEECEIIVKEWAEELIQEALNGK